MRIGKALLSSAVSAAIAVFSTPQAQAQTFFQSVFGTGGGAAPQQSFAPRARTIPPHRFSAPRARLRQMRAAGEPQDEEIGPPNSGGPYRTVCVRTCDGFYFPVRARAKRKNFAADVRSCRSACGTNAKLFYAPAYSTAGADALVDLAGRKYADLPHAFAYRKSLTEGCTCKPVPWSVEEAERHRVYAEREAIELAKDQAYLQAKAAAEAKARPLGGKEAETAYASGALASQSGVAWGQFAATSGAASVSVLKLALGHAGMPPADRAEPRIAATMEAAPHPVEVAGDDVQTATQRAIERPVARRRTARLARPQVQRAKFVPASSGFQVFGKSKYVWPGDR